MSNNKLCKFLTISKRSDFNKKIVEYYPMLCGNYNISSDAAKGMYQPDNVANIKAYLDSLQYASSTGDIIVPTYINSDIANADVNFYDIVFIEDTKEIWTQGKFYQSICRGTNPTSYTLSVHTIFHEGDNFAVHINMKYCGFHEVPLKITYWGGLDSTSMMIYNNFTLIVTFNMISNNTAVTSFADIKWGMDMTGNHAYKKKQCAIYNNIITKTLCFYPGALALELNPVDNQYIILVEGIGVTDVVLITLASYNSHINNYGRIILPSE